MVAKILGAKRATPPPPVNATATLVLSQLSYTVGEVVQGQLTIAIPGPEPFVCEGATVSLTGLEHLKWEEDINDSWCDREAKHQFLKLEIPLPVSIETPMLPGHHVFPFAFPLATNLPASFINKETADARWGVIEARVTYAVQAVARVKGHEKPVDLVGHPVILRALPMFPVPPRRPVQEIVSRRVKFFCCFEKGTCEVSAIAGVDTFDLMSGMVNIHATVLNGTTLTIKGLVFSLRRVVTFHVPAGYGHQGNNAITRVLYKQIHSESIAPGTRREKIPMQFAMTKILTTLPAALPLAPDHAAGILSPALRPTENLLFSSVSYRIVIEVQFATGMCSAVELELPVSIYHFPIQDVPVNVDTAFQTVQLKVDELQVQDLS